MQCPKCRSSRLITRNTAKKAGGVIGTTGGAVSGAAGAFSGAELGAAVGVVGGPVGIALGTLAGALLGGLLGVQLLLGLRQLAVAPLQLACALARRGGRGGSTEEGQNTGRGAEERSSSLPCALTC